MPVDEGCCAESVVAVVVELEGFSPGDVAGVIPL